MSASCNLVHIILLLTTTSIINADNLSVETTSGKLVGSAVQFTHEDTQHTVNVYRGIPFAEPPIGDLRFRPPVPKSPWSGEYNATYFRDICIQPTYHMFEMKEKKSEDCLYLNVYVPQHESKKYAVMVWIHGGAFAVGSGSTVSYDGTPLAAINDVMVVTINYRLDALGFLTTGDSAASGNYGLLDQLEALKWVKANVEAFGGDSERITIFGESAGAYSVHLHMLSPLSSGLFHRAILQSGALSEYYGYTDDKVVVNKVAYALGRQLGCEHDNSEDLIQCLRKVPAEEFAQDSLMEVLGGEIEGSNVTQTFNPHLDDYFIPKDPLGKLSSGSFNTINSIVGTMADEGMVWMTILFGESEDQPFVDRATFDESCSFVLSPHVARHGEVHDAVKYLYTDWEYADSTEYNYLDVMSQIAGDPFFVCPANRCARDLYDAGADVYLYQIDYHPTTSAYKKTWTKAAHGDDEQYVFGWQFLPQLYPDIETKFQMKDEEHQMSLQIMKYFTNFAKSGNPNLDDGGAVTDIEWPKFTVPELQYKELSPSMPTKRALKAKECAFWDQVVPNLIQNAAQMKESCLEETTKTQTDNEETVPEKTEL
ncbi:pyrethroid hydrolase Ces2e-like [Glandiceps talaboti]